MATLQKGSQITARSDSSVNVLDYPLGTGNVVETFRKGELVGYASSDEIFIDKSSNNDPSTFIEVLYFSETTFLPVAVGYVDQDSVEIGEPLPDNSTIPVEDENGNTLPESERKNGVTITDPETGEKKVIVVKNSPAANAQNPFPTWAKWTIIGIATVLTIVAGVWIYGQYKKSKKGKKS